MPQRLPHAPQLALSASVFVQLAPHCVSPAPHPHVPLTQEPPTGHSLPQAPQLSESLVVSTHALLQLVRVTPASVVEQSVVQTPALQTCPVAQALPHAPQLFGSLETGTQAPVHSIDPEAHAHVPL